MLFNLNTYLVKENIPFFVAVCTEQDVVGGVFFSFRLCHLIAKLLLFCVVCFVSRIGNWRLEAYSEQCDLICLANAMFVIKGVYHAIICLIN